MAREDLDYVEIDAFTEYIVSELYDCPKGLRDQALLQQIIYFQEQSQIWKCDLYPMNIVKNKDTYDLTDIPDYAFVERVDKVEKEDIELQPSLDYVMERRNEMRLIVVPAAASSQALKVRVILKNKSGTTRTWKRLFDDWRDAITHGVLWKLTAQPSKTWTNFQLSRYHKFEFWQAIADARADINRELMNETLGATKGGFI